jgi:hypothetical protein
VDRWPRDVEPTNPSFPYDRTESSSYHTFKHWVPSPPNPPPMIDEKGETTTCHIHNSPLCKCGYHSKLVNLPTGLDYTLFWHCPIPLLVIVHRRKCLLCDQSIDSMYMILTYYCHWISMSLFMVLLIWLFMLRFWRNTACSWPPISRSFRAGGVAW